MQQHNPNFFAYYPETVLPSVFLQSKKTQCESDFLAPALSVFWLDKTHIDLSRRMQGKPVRLPGKLVRKCSTGIKSNEHTSLLYIIGPNSALHIS